MIDEDNINLLDIPDRKKNQLKKKGFSSLEDILRYFPAKYYDCRHETGILSQDKLSVISAVLDQISNITTKTGRPMAAATCTMSDGQILKVIWFNQPWIGNSISHLRGKKVLVCGHVTLNEQYGNYNIIAPTYFIEDLPENRKYIPVYKKIPQMSDEYLTKIIDQAFELGFPRLEETIPEDTLEELDIIPLQQAVNDIHHPTSPEAINTARKRFLFEELLYFALRIEIKGRDIPMISPFLAKDMSAYSDLLSYLPYSLTEDQKAAVDDALATIRSGRRLNALLQGDVGCGKSIVAFILMIVMASNGYQAAIMAPTQILAEQHFQELSEIAEHFGYRVGFLGSGMKAAQKNETLRAIESGEINLVVGTHAIIGRTVKFKKLALAIIDEEHRFGVSQREELREKAKLGAHVLTMSATPIPRSFAQIIYGNSVQLLSIKTMPNGRKPVITGIGTDMNKTLRFIVHQAQQGHQAYVVCPAISSETNTDMAAIDEVSEFLKAKLSPYGIKIGVLTGKNKKDEMSDIITEFKSGKTMVLVSTTVVEVGVNVPSATTMVIMDADRFGLATLHQLRGRVGRGTAQSFCVLYSRNNNEKSIQRLNAMCTTGNGLEISKADLDLRGAGDFLGTKQSGSDKFMDMVVMYPDVYEKVKPAAKKMLNSIDQQEKIPKIIQRAYCDEFCLEE